MGLENDTFFKIGAKQGKSNSDKLHFLNFYIITEFPIISDL